MKASRKEKRITLWGKTGMTMGQMGTPERQNISEASD
jgi:hypothetical protein